MFCVIFVNNNKYLDFFFLVFSKTKKLTVGQIFNYGTKSYHVLKNLQFCNP